MGVALLILSHFFSKISLENKIIWFRRDQIIHFHGMLKKGPEGKGG